MRTPAQKYARIQALKRDKSPLSLAALCEAFEVSRSGYHRFARAHKGPRTLLREKIRATVTELFESSRRTYGYRRIRVLLERKGLKANRKTVAAVMRELGLRGRRKGRFKPKTTDSDHGGPIAPNLFALVEPSAPDTVWQTDITYIETDDGWMYLAGIMDAFTRRLVGWAVAPNMETSLVLRALNNAVTSRRPAPGLLHHSDRGGQYASDAYLDKLAELGFVRSMSRKGNCYDNAASESFWSTLKLEWLHGLRFATRAEVEPALFDYIDGWYNPRRLHSSLGYRSPVDFEKSLVI